jgi:hypothetical protein
LSSRGDNSLATTGVDIAKRLGVVGSERWFPVCNAVDRKKLSASQNYRSQKDDTMAASIHHVMDRQEPESKRSDVSRAGTNGDNLPGSICDTLPHRFGYSWFPYPMLAVTSLTVEANALARC